MSIKYRKSKGLNRCIYYGIVIDWCENIGLKLNEIKQKMNKIKMKSTIFGLLFVLVASLVAITSVSTVSAALPNDIQEMTVYVEGNAVWHGYCYLFPDPTPIYDEFGRLISVGSWKCSTYQIATPALERGSEMTVKVVFKGGRDLSNVKIHTWINGYRDEIESRTGEFDVFANDQYTRSLFLQIPSDIDARDRYTLYVSIEGKRQFTGVGNAVMNLDVQRDANLLEIKSVDLYDHNADNIFTSGNTMFADVVVKNRGNHRADDVYVRVSIPEMGVSRNVYIGDLAPYDNDDEDAVKATLALPLLVGKEGQFTVNIETYNSELSTKTTRTITVVKEQTKNVQIMPQITQADANSGDRAKYSLIVSNLGETSEDFTVEVLGTEGWAVVQTNPASFSLAPGQNKLVQINLDVDKDAETMQYPFTVRVRYGNEAKQYNYIANVTKTGFDWKIALTILGIVLAVAVIVLLVVMLVKQGKKNPEQESEFESYY